MGNVVRTAASVAAAAFLAAACAGRSPEVPVAPATTQSVLPDAVQIVCDANGTTVLTPVVRPQRDGVHLHIQNTTGEDLGFIVGADGDNAPAGSSELIWPLPPGTAKVGCVAPSAPGDTPPDGEVTIQDPDGIWSDPGTGPARAMAVFRSPTSKPRRPKKPSNELGPPRKTKAAGEADVAGNTQAHQEMSL